MDEQQVNTQSDMTGPKLSRVVASDIGPINVEVVRQLYSAFAKGDIPGILSLLSPDVVWGEPENPYNPAAGTRHGHRGFMEWIKIGSESEEILSMEPRQFLTNRESVAVVGHTTCLAKPTGKTYETDFVHLVTFKDGQVVRFQEFFDTFSAGEAFRP
jgi:ketosteroid isomerase-like protein